MPLDQKTTWAPAVCPHDCPSTCALEVEVLAPDRIGKVRGSHRVDYTAGVICAKVARYAERAHHPERLMHPLKRVGAKGDGIDAFQRISWDEAMDEIAARFQDAERAYGAETVWPYYYAGTMGLVQRDGIERLRHVRGWSRQWNTICTMLPESGWFAGVGQKAGVDPREVAHSDVIVVWGGNPVNTQVNFMTHAAKAKKARGAKLVVIDVYETGTAQQADLFLMVKPGTDGALANAVMHILLRDGLADRDYLARHTDWDARVEDHLRACTPEWAAAVTGVPEETIEAFAALYGSTKKSYIRVGYGFARSRNGQTNLHAVSCLPAVTGAWQEKGGGALWGNGAIYRLDKTMIEGLDVRDRSVRKLDQSRFGPVMTNDPADLGDGPPITALLIQNTNPAVVCPESLKCREGLLRDDLFTVVHEQFMTDTAKMADIVLPATCFLEHDDMYTASGHTHLQLMKAVIEAPGECRSNHEVHCDLARRLGASHPGFEMSPWELIDWTFRHSGWPGADEVLAQGGFIDCAEPFEQMHFLDGFPQPDKRFHFKPDWRQVGLDAEDMPDLPGYWEAEEKADEVHPFRLVAAPARGYLNTSFNETPGSQKREGRPTAMMHPDACARLGLADGQRVRLGNARGSVVVALRPFEGVLPDTVVVESLHPNDAFEEGIGINALIGADPGKPRGGAVFHDTAIWVRPAE